MANDPVDKGGPDHSDLLGSLASFTSLHGLLADHKVKKAMIFELQSIGVPLPGLAYRAIVFLTGGCENFLGVAVKTRLQAFLNHTPLLAGVLQKLCNLQHGARTQDQLRGELLKAIESGDRPNLDTIEVDTASSIDLVLALNNAKGFERVLDGLDAQTETLIKNFQTGLNTLYQNIVEPDLSWPATAVLPDQLGAFDRLKYTSGLDELVGREDELDLLARFVGDLSYAGKIFNFRWMLLTAEGGSGKTRLAHAFTTERLDPKFWYAGKLDHAYIHGLFDSGKWRPRKPTFIVIDYAQNAPEEIGKLLRDLSTNAAKFEWPVRLLMLERRADPTWTSRLLPNDGYRPSILEHCFGNEGVEGRVIPPIMPGAIGDLMQGRFEQAGVAAPPRDELVRAAYEIDPKHVFVEHNGQAIGVPVPRPLFALAVADELVRRLEAGDTQGVTELDRDAIMQGIVTRESEKRWAEPAKDDDDLTRHKVLLALSTLMQGLDLTLMSKKAEFFGSAAGWLPDVGPSANRKLLASIGSVNARLPQLEPDILGEFFVLDVLVDPYLDTETKIDLIAGAISHSHPETIITLLRIFNDFPHRFDELLVSDILAGSGQVTVSERIASALPDLMSVAFEHGRPESADKLLEAADKSLERHRDNPEIALGLAKAAVNVTNHAGEAGDWTRVDAMLARLDALRATPAFAENAEIAVEEAEAAVNVTNHAGEASDWTRVDAMLARLDALRATPAFAENAEIAVREAKAAFNVTNHAGEASDWTRVDAMLTRLDALRATPAFAENAEIAVREAKTAFNVTYDAAKAGDWTRVDAMRKRVDRMIDQLGEAFVISRNGDESVTLAHLRAYIASVLDQRGE